MLGLSLLPGSPVLSRLVVGGLVPPSWSAPPAITGSSQVGQTLISSDGAVAGGSVTARYWRRDGVPIGGATDATYLLVGADVGATIDLRVTASGAGGTAQATSADIGPVTAAAIATILIEGDSITEFGGAGGFARNFGAYRPDKTVIVRAQNSRTVGGAAYAGPPAENEDTGTPAGNTLLAHRTADLATGPQLIATMIGANDLATFSVGNYIAHLIAWAAPIRQAGVKVAWSAPTPYNAADPSHPSYGQFTTARASLLATCRDPAVWGQWCDIFMPMGEHPDYADAALLAGLYGDTVHLNQAGHDRLLAVSKAALDTVVDAGRIGATQMYGSAWLGSETDLATGTEIVRRFVVKGLAHGGIALTGGNALSVTGGGARLRRGGSAWETSVSGWLYNGDVIDLRLTTSGSHATATSIALTVGSETRILGFSTGANVAPVGYSHGDVVNLQAQAATHTYASIGFAAPGTAVLAIAAGGIPTAVTVDGIAAVKRLEQGADASLSVWTAPIAAAGTRDVVVAFASYKGHSTLSHGVVTGANATPVQADAGAPGYQAQPFETGALTVPANGLAVAFLAEYGGASIAPGTTSPATIFVDEGHGSFQSETLGLVVGTRATSGTASFQFGFGKWAIGALVFKAAGT